MINLDDCVEIGFVSKTHGVHGQLVVKLSQLSFDDIIEMELVFILIDGLPVPFFIEEFSERIPDSIILKLDDINSEPDAKKLTSLTVFTHSKYLTDSQKSHLQQIDLLKGYSIIDNNKGNIGVLDSVVQNTANPLLLITNGNQEILLPLQEEFILDILDDQKQILVDCPEGLLELFK